MQSGLLRQQVKIQSRIDGIDAAGDAMVSWLDVATIWADVQPLRGLERMNAQQVGAAAIDHRITTRYRPGLTPKHRILYGTRVFDIESVINVNERNEMIELLCKEAA